MLLSLWFGHYHIIIQGTLILKTIQHRVQRIDRNIDLEVYTKLTNFGGNCITGNVASFWRMWRVKAQILRRFSGQEHDTRQSLSGIYCWIFHLKNTFQCACIWCILVLFAVFFSLIFWVSHLINQDKTTAFCIIRKCLLFCKIFKLAPAKRAHWSTYQLMYQSCPLMPRNPPHWSCNNSTFFCDHLHEWTWD
jgi:hypothetical protein